MKILPIERLLSYIGIGTKNECKKLILQKKVFINNNLITNPKTQLKLHFSDKIKIENEEFPYESELLIALNKPKGYECSNKPSANNKSVFSLLPQRFLSRKNPILCAGRLGIVFKLITRC
jgi:16S rRNA pseudouridine516 synthase